MHIVADAATGTIRVGDDTFQVDLPSFPEGVTRITWDDEQERGVMISGEVQEGGSHSSEVYTDREQIEPFIAAYETAKARHEAQQQAIRAELEAREAEGTPRRGGFEPIRQSPDLTDLKPPPLLHGTFVPQFKKE